MVRRACDGDGLLEAFRAAVANLEAHVEEVNALNVYPVPDGDTGSNMVATVRAALAEAEAVDRPAPADRVAAAISFGALMGARGNSGVITSQILRGLADGLATRSRFNGPDLAHALAKGSEAAYRAVARPVEGTILTVIREASGAAVSCADNDGDLEAVLTATVEMAERSVARTPSLLTILREAGVVDSGGQGLYRLLQGALRFLVEGSPAGPRLATQPQQPRLATLVAHADAGFGYETMYLLRAQPGITLDVDAIRTHLESIGDSVLVAGDGRAVKVHVHNERPDQVIAYGLGLGTLSRISVENLDGQVHELREARADAFARTDEPDPSSLTTAASSRGGIQPPASSTASLPLSVVAVVAGEGLEAIFREFGVASVVRGGQATNPSTGDLLAAVEGVDAREVILLPNNPNVILAARQVAAMAGRPVEVIPTRNAAEGFAALLALDPTRDAAGNVASMTRAARNVQTLLVTEAVRDSTIGGRAIRKGQVIVLDPDDGLVAGDVSLEGAVSQAVTALRPGFELLTIYYGAGSTLAEAEGVARLLSGQAEGVEVEVVHGGQPFYRYLISAE